MSHLGEQIDLVEDLVFFGDNALVFVGQSEFRDGQWFISVNINHDETLDIILINEHDWVELIVFVSIFQ